MSKSGSVRTTISVPADLKRRMNKVKEDVNWSAIACQAFEKHLGELASRKERKSMQDVIQRLRASKQESDSEQFREGFEAGQEWAKDEAEAIELKRLYGLYSRCYGDDWPQLFSDDDTARWSPSQCLYYQLHPECADDRIAAESFWEVTLGPVAFDQKLHREPEWMRGFVEGAIHIWEQVKDQVA